MNKILLAVVATKLFAKPLFAIIILFAISLSGHLYQHDVVRFSQASISDPGIWDISKYEPIDVVSFGEAPSFTSLDNKRLYMAQAANVQGLDV